MRFFDRNFSSIGSAPIPTELGRIRVAQLDAWLRRIQIADTYANVWVKGDAFNGVRVEINGSGAQVDKKVGTTGRVRLRLPRGLPDDAYLYLSREGCWLDHRPLGPRLWDPNDPAQDDIEVLVDAETEIEVLRTYGEGQNLEYKSQLPKKNDVSRRKHLKTVAAFASGAGGIVLYGIEPDEVTTVGINGVPEEIRDQLGELIRRYVDPPDPTFEVR